MFASLFEPLYAAGPVITLHALAALAAVGLGAVQLAAPKGTLPHRVLGYGWAGLMMVIAASGFWIHELRLLGPWSPIHLLSILVLVSVPLAILRARRHRHRAHRNAMLALYVLALLVAGGFTLLPGRVMHEVVMGGTQGAVEAGR